MNVTEAITAIAEWYDGEDFLIRRIVQGPDDESSKDGFEESEKFEEVSGWQKGDESGMGGGFYGVIYFKIKEGEWIETVF